MNWKFFLDGTQTSKDPSNWDGFEYVLSRSDAFAGVESVFSDTKLSFWREDSTYLISRFSLFGFDATVDLKIQALCGDEIVDEITGVLNFLHYSERGGEVSLVFDESSFSRKFKNRLDVKVDFSSLKSVDETNLPEPDYFKLKLHSKEIIYQGKQFLCSPIPTRTYHLKPDLVRPNWLIQPWFDQNTTDIKSFSLPTVEEPILQNAADGSQAVIDQSPTVAPGIATDYHISWSGEYTLLSDTNITIELIAHPGFDAFVDFSHPTEIIDSINLVANVPYTYTFDLTHELNLFQGQGGYILIYAIKGDALEDVHLSITFTTNILLIEDAKRAFAPTECRAIDIYNAFKRVAQNITGEIDCFRSNFFGRPEIFPFKEAGCGAYVAVTNGLNLRNVLDKNNQMFPISMNWNELYNAADAVFQLGWNIEYNSYGKPFVRVENVEYYYSSEVIAQYLNVANITIDVASDYLINSVEIGYDKWNLNNGGLNGIDEFNTKHNYSLAVLNPQNKLSKVSKFIASGYVIELTRREQPTLSKSGKICDVQPPPNDPVVGNKIAAGQKDFETDNENFFICTNTQAIDKADVPEGMYVKPTGGTYKAGTISERNENFDIVGNLISPETSYNLRISPKRNLIRWYSYVAISLVGKANPKVKFVNGQGNFQEFDKYKVAAYTCDGSGTHEIRQDEDLTPSDLKDAIPLFKPVYVSFETKIDFTEFLNLRRNSNKAIQVSCNTSNLITGSLKELRYLPNKDGGVGQFKILAAVCVNGSFSNGFDNGFDIGTC